jgi:hypothetical protein
MFHEIQGSSVILKSGGVFRQAKCYSYNGTVFAKWGNGFIKLKKYMNGTSVPHVSWEAIDLPFTPTFSNTGDMNVPTA